MDKNSDLLWYCPEDDSIIICEATSFCIFMNEYGIFHLRVDNEFKTYKYYMIGPIW